MPSSYPLLLLSVANVALAGDATVDPYPWISQDMPEQYRAQAAATWADRAARDLEGALEARRRTRGAHRGWLFIAHESGAMPSMSDSFLVQDSVLKPVYRYSSQEQLLGDLETEVIGPANEWAEGFEKKLAELRREYVPWQGKGKS